MRALKYTGNDNYKEAYQEMIKNDFLIKWLASKNIAVIIGNYLFVHAGISVELLNSQFTVYSMNKIAREGKKYDSKNYELIFGKTGPLWYRGMVQDYKDFYKKISKNEINKILNFHSVDKIIVGHTVVDDISYDFDNKILRIDVKHGKNQFSGKTSGIYITNDSLFKIDDLGNKYKIYNMAVSEKPKE